MGQFETVNSGGEDNDPFKPETRTVIEGNKKFEIRILPGGKTHTGEIDSHTGLPIVENRPDRVDVDSIQKRCPTCGGTRLPPAETGQLTHQAKKDYTKTETCPTCKGNGWIK